jgi:17beta-estradiol 17-dehydrogenase / very-long-chain 3-oxoacyl-CoA reductase
MLDILMSITLKQILIVIILINLLRLLRFIYKNFLRPRIDLKQRYGKGTWALVTGATDGIGKAFCEELAREGFNIILVSRNPDKLRTVANELEKGFKISTACIPFDFNEKTSLKDYIEVFDGLDSRFDISILVNNVGTTARGNFLDTDIAAISNVLNCNILPQTYLSRLIGNGMRERSHRCAIINLSSILAMRPMPYSSIYSSTKVFNHYLTEAVSLEHNTSNIDFLSVKPFYTKTAMIKNLKDTFCVIEPQQCVEGALNDLSYELTTPGHWKHKIFSYISSWMPMFYLRYKMKKRLQAVKVD